MHKRRFIWLTLLLAVGLLLPATPALADGDPPDGDGVVIWNEDYILGEDEQLDGDLVVFNGDVTLESGSRVTGSVVVWNGDANVEGTVEEDLIVSGGDIYLGESARVQGDVVCSWDCDVEQEKEAHVDGRIVEGIPLRDLRLDRWRGFPRPPVTLPSPPTSWVSGPKQVLGWVLGVMRDVVGILVIAAVAGLVALIWPHQTRQVGNTVVKAPWPSFGMGLLTLAAATALIIILAITICLSPFAALAALALGAAGLFGWIGVGILVGERLLQTLQTPENKTEIAPMWAAGLGTLLITLIGVGLSAAFCLAVFGWVMIFALGCLGLGAVVLTRFGTAAYAPPRPTPSPPTLATGKEPEPPEPQEEAESSESPEEESNET
ncbi:MAG: polymer-forming cytoskeletal protein [Chloroflexota bacterium]|nr:polymer-forming cytoskeletal protein [Chloroflexota bacterium]